MKMKDTLQKKLQEMERESQSPSLENAKPTLNDKLSFAKRLVPGMVKSVPQKDSSYGIHPKRTFLDIFEDHYEETDLGYVDYLRSKHGISNGPATIYTVTEDDAGDFMGSCRMENSVGKPIVVFGKLTDNYVTAVFKNDSFKVQPKKNEENQVVLTGGPSVPVVFHKYAINLWEHDSDHIGREGKATTS